MEITHQGCILSSSVSIASSRYPDNEKWTFPLNPVATARMIQQELTVTPFSSFCQKKGYDNSKQAFPLYKRLSPTTISVPRQFMIDHFPIERSSPFDLSSEHCGWATPKDQMQPLAVPLRPLQHEIIYEKLLPHLSNCYYQISADKSFFFGGGLIILPCGYGKTKTVEEFFYSIGQHVPNGYRMLCICPTKAIAKQTAIAFRRDLKGCKVAILRAQDSSLSSSSAVVAGKRVLVSASAESSSSKDNFSAVPAKVLALIRSVDVVVTLMSTLKSRNYGPAFYAHFGIVVIDEVHHMTAKGNSQLFFAMNPPIMIGLTAEFDNKSRTFSLLEKCIGPRIFEKRDRDGQDDIVVRKCHVNEEVLRYFFQGRKNEAELIARMQTVVQNADGGMDYSRTISNLMECKELHQFWCDHLLHMVDSIPEDMTFMSTVKTLRPVFSPVESPDLCDQCSQECVFAFQKPVAEQPSIYLLFCHACVSELYFQQGDSLGGFRRKSPEEIVAEEARKRSNPRKRKAKAKTKAASAGKAKRRRTCANGDDQDEEEEDEDEEEEEGDGELRDADVERMLQESLDISRSIYEGTYFGRNQILVLCERVNPLCMLAELLKEQRPDLAGEIGNIAGKNGNELELQRSRGKQIILATLPKAKEGMDVPTLNSTVNLTPTTTIRQSMGRALRTKGRKYVYDFIYPSRMFWLQFQNHRKPEYDDHKCKYENFKLPKFQAWKKRQAAADKEDEEEEGGGGGGEEGFNSNLL